MSFDPLSDLTKEGSFWDLRRLAGGLRSKHRVAYWITIVLVALCSAAGAAFTAVDVGELLRTTNAAMFGFAATILGILIAGFAIFTTIAGSEVASSLALLEHERSGMSKMKWIALHFTSVFVRYLEFLAFSCLVWFFGFKGGLGTWIASALTTPSFPGGKYVASVVFGVLSGFVVLLLIELATFVFNVHAGFMMMVRGRIDPYSKRFSQLRQEEIDADAKKAFDEAAGREIERLEVERAELQARKPTRARVETTQVTAPREPDDPKVEEDEEDVQRPGQVRR
jgi:hypothetical protein